MSEKNFIRNILGQKEAPKKKKYIREQTLDDIINGLDPDYEEEEGGYDDEDVVENGVIDITSGKSPEDAIRDLGRALGYNSIEEFLDDNPGIVEKIAEFVIEQATSATPEWADAIKDAWAQNKP